MLNACTLGLGRQSDAFTAIRDGRMAIMEFLPICLRMRDETRLFVVVPLGAAAWKELEG